MVRMTANPSVTRTAIRVAMQVTGISQKAMALTAGIPESVLSDALNGRGRHLETDWILAQSEAFINAFWKSIEAQLGLTSESKREVRAARIGELVRLLMEETA